MKFDVIVADPPWELSDRLTMSDVKRGAASQYSVLDIEAIKTLDVKSIAQTDCVLALWVPSSLLQEGLDTMKAWGFEHKQTAIWVKTKKEPLKSLAKQLRPKLDKKEILNFLKSFDLNNVLDFNLGRLFRQTHEICLLGIRGRVYSKMENRSQRSVHFAPGLAHSSKPEILQPSYAY